jgi:hypothetical protein
MAKVEKETTWGLLVSEDEIFSPRTGKWHEIMEVRHRGADVTVRLTGGGKEVPQFTKPATTKVRVRRSKTGQVVDMFAVVFSGPA